MIAIETDVERELLTVIYCGHVVPEEFALVEREFREALGRMEEGFRLLTDLGGLESMMASCAPYIDKFMDLIDARGVTTVVRIIPDPKKDIGFQVMSYFHYRPEVNIVTYESVEEAAKVLER